ncbi:hypothetical protein N7520_003012 [Penicillium odoratum]|uniref:uncharacterized protein n=1 Tax=Penicillium odoratum TaxID=1167516 RepID=UPI0025466847|nr:uncharacterized protein N7520_003012 [Penicillium odoratum]KAJ5772483.1 hypothetical protein N7520_003012 [Penicillium odoratum]
MECLCASLTPPYTADNPLSKSAQNVINRYRLHSEGYPLSPWCEGRLRPNDYRQALLRSLSLPPYNCRVLSTVHFVQDSGMNY